MKWMEEIARVFRAVQDCCEIKITTSCSTHVHVSMGDSRTTYTIDQLRAAFKSMVFFKEAITKIVPAHRKHNPWCISNVRASESTSRKVTDLYKKVTKNGFGPLFGYVDSQGTRNFHQAISGSSNARYQSWNFEHVATPRGTIEFRRPPGLDSGRDAVFWVGFALAFIAKAMTTDYGVLGTRKTPGTVEELKEAIEDGVRALAGEEDDNNPSTMPLDLDRIKEDVSSISIPTRNELQFDIKARIAKGTKASTFAN